MPSIAIKRVEKMQKKENRRCSLQLKGKNKKQEKE